MYLITKCIFNIGKKRGEIKMYTVIIKKIEVEENQAERERENDR